MLDNLAEQYSTKRILRLQFLIENIISRNDLKKELKTHLK